MRLSWAFLSALAVSGVMSADIPVLGTYAHLRNLCMNGGPNTYVGVRYTGGSERTFKYNECYPYKIGSNLAEMAVFCKSVTCYSNPNPDCTGGAVPPVPVPVVASLTLINAADWVRLLGQGATCQENSLPPK